MAFNIITTSKWLIMDPNSSIIKASITMSVLFLSIIDGWSLILINCPYDYS